MSGIAALTGWLILGGRRRDRAPVRATRTSGATVTLADEMPLDFEVIINRPGGTPAPRYSGRVPAASAPLWRVEDDRPRWLRRLDEQRPEPARARRSSIPSDEESMPWLAGVTWPDDGGAGRGGDDRN